MSCACYVNNIEFIRSSLSRKSFVIFRRFTTMTTEEGTNHVTELCIYNQLTRITQIYEVFVERWWCDSRVEEMKKKEHILVFDTTKYRLSNVCSTDCDLLDKYYDKTVWSYRSIRLITRVGVE